MAPSDMETLLRNIDARTARLEQILPTLATKAEMAKLPTRAAIATLATNAEMAKLPTREEIATLATKEELAAAVSELPTRAEMREGLAEVRRHALVLHEAVRSDIQLLAEHIAGLGHR